MLEWLLSWLWWIPWAVWRWLWRFARERPYVAFLVIVGIARSFGTTVQTGTAGVLFSFGRARKVLEPGFHWLLPIVQQVRHTPIRSVTLDLPRQRVTTADGLVYDADTTIVYRVEEPIRALTEINDVRQGVLTMIPLLVHEILRGQTHESLGQRSALDQELTQQARTALARWGVTVETAGFSTIAPTRPTVRLTQLAARIGERSRLLNELTRAGVDPTIAMLLTAGQTGPRGRSAARYRRHRVPVSQDAAARATVSVVLPPGGWLSVGEMSLTWTGTQTFATPKLERQRQYVYALTMTRILHGWPISETRNVTVMAGIRVRVDFTRPAEAVPIGAAARRHDGNANR